MRFEMPARCATHIWASDFLLCTWAKQETLQNPSLPT